MDVRFHLVVLSAVVMSVGLAGCDAGPSAPTGQAPQGRTGAETAASALPSGFAAVGDLKEIHFDLDQARIRPQEARLLEGNARWLKSRQEMMVMVGGHADERGSEEYNMRLGERRADAVKRYLIGQGVEADRIQTASYGERQPTCPDRSEGCWSKNRRAEFQVKPR
jgi:peptidoglycan-associated lipoprotein